MHELEQTAWQEMLLSMAAQLAQPQYRKYYPQTAPELRAKLAFEMEELTNRAQPYPQGSSYIQVLDKAADVLLCATQLQALGDNEVFDTLSATVFPRSHVAFADVIAAALTKFLYRVMHRRTTVLREHAAIAAVLGI
jgi:hypothetical protein